MSNAEVQYIVRNVQCCRVWPVVTETFTHGSKGFKHEYWHWRNCGLCGNKPRLIEEDRS